MSLSREIEKYLKSLFSKGNVVEIQRNELADFFNCVPSQINYVLSTRFTPSQGYLVESRRGGGGYLRIVKLSWERIVSDDLKEVFKSLNEGIDLNEAEGLLRRLYEEENITAREYYLLKGIISRETLQLKLPERDLIRARILQAVLAALIRNDI